MIAALLLAAAAEPPPGPGGGFRPGWLYRLAWIFYLLLAVAGALWIGMRAGSIPPELFVRPSVWWQDAGLGAGAAALLLAGWELLRRRAPAARRLERDLAELLGGLDRVQVAALALLSGFAEELFFRGAVQSAWGWLPATLLFAVLHGGPGPAYRLWGLFALAAGAALGGLMEWRGALLAPVTAHVLVNWINLSRLAAMTPAAHPSIGGAADGGGPLLDSPPVSRAAGEADRQVQGEVEERHRGRSDDERQ